MEPLRSLDELRHRQRLRLLRKAQQRTRPTVRMQLLRVALAVLFLGAVLWTHTHIGEAGVVVLALLVLLGLSHPLWLLLPPGTKRSSPFAPGGRARDGQPDPTPRH
jgi:hypothetical protein